MKKRLIYSIFFIIIFLFSINVHAAIIGDVNGDGKISVGDYVLIRKHILSNPKLTGDKLKRADVNADGKISSLDYVLIRNKILNKDLILQTKLDLENINNAVGIVYSTWFNPVIDSSVKPPLVVDVNPLNAGYIYYWGKPAKGFYRSDNKEVIRYHMDLLNEAGVDFIIIDNTNAREDWVKQYSWFGKPSSTTSYWEEMVSKSEKALLDTIYEMNSEGLETPKVVMWSTSSETVINRIYNEFYTNNKYKNIWLYYEGKPLYLTTQAPPKNNNFTMRKMWGLEPSRADSVWSFLEKNNSPSSNNEQISVSVAIQETYMSESTALCRNKGKTFHDQWVNAFKAHPKVVTITWWNEWTAIALNVNGKVQLTDNYNTECSRDIEPMEGGHGDKYYQLMKLYIENYKSNQSIKSYEWYKNKVFGN